MVIPCNVILLGTSCNTGASKAEQTASQTKAAVSAYWAARTATVPPPVIAANRTLLMQLIQSNVFGQNAPAIGTVEAQYAEMWAQDAAAMYGYATSSGAASTLTPFTDPPQTTNPGGQATQAASVAQVAGTSAGANAQSTVSQLPGSLTPGLGSPGTTGASGLTSVSSTLGELANIAALPAQGFANGVGSYSTAADLISNINNGMGLATFAAQNPGKLVEALNPPFLGPASSLGMSGRAGVSAGLGQAIQIGAVSVPQGWAMPTSAITPVAMTLPGGSPAAATLIDVIPGDAFAETMLGTLAGRGLGAVTARNVVSRNRKVVPQSPAVG
jgi:PPE-repeat protein